MNKLAVLLLAAVLSFNGVLIAQQDSLYLTSVTVEAGDTAIVSLYLQNQSFSVGAFHAELNLSDTSLARFVSVGRGHDVQDFSYFYGMVVSAGAVSLTGIASMPLSPSEPLPVGEHEIALFKIIVSDSITSRAEVTISFSDHTEFNNVISDSTGYEVVEPTLLDGTITILQYISIDDEEYIPEEFALKGNYPNPFNSHTIIEFSLNNPGYVNLEIFDIQGRKVRDLVSDYYNSGNYSVSWNGCTSNGTLVSSGIYLYRLSSGGYSQTGRMNFVK